jgi:DNA-directed RNA polymerase specialized sigma24 family protein
LTEIEEMARDLIVALMAVHPDAFDLAITWPEEVHDYAVAVQDAREALRVAQAGVDTATRNAVQALLKQDLSVQEIAAVLQLSTARIYQVLNGTNGHRRRSAAA